MATASVTYHFGDDEGRYLEVGVDADSSSPDVMDDICNRTIKLYQKSFAATLAIIAATAAVNADVDADTEADTKADGE